MANKWYVVVFSEYGTEWFDYDTPKAQVKGMARLLETAQKHGNVDTVKRAVFAIPDPYRDNMPLEEFISHYTTLKEK